MRRLSLFQGDETAIGMTIDYIFLHAYVADNFFVPLLIRTTVYTPGNDAYQPLLKQLWEN
jgi:hypothetical protein